MSSSIDLEGQLKLFDTQQYPSAEETLQSNKTSLYKRRKSFLEDLKHIIKSTGYLLIILAYLKDASSFLFIIRIFNQYSLSEPFLMLVNLTEERKRVMSKQLLIRVIGVNLVCMTAHIFRWRHQTGASLVTYGGFTVQFIGERATFLSILLYDIAVSIIQLVYHNLMCVVDTVAVLDTNSRESTDVAPGEQRTEGDGYEGNVNIVSIDLFGDIKKVLKFNDIPIS